MDSLLVLTLPDHGPGSMPGSMSAQADGPNGPEALDAAIEVLRTRADVQVCPIVLPGDLDSALHRRGGRSIVVAGGDAGLHTVVSALHRRTELDDTVLGILPVAGCNFAQGASIPTSPLDAARVILAGAQRRFDLVVDCRGDVVVNGAAVTARPNRALAGLRELSGVEGLPEFGTRPLHVRVVADEEVVCDFDQPVVGVDVNNCTVGSSVGRGGRRGRAPDADPCDGYADVVVSFARSRLRRVRNAVRRGGHHLARTDILHLRARKVSVAGQWFSLATDGEDTGAEQRCTWTVMPERLRMIVPG